MESNQLEEINLCAKDPIFFIKNYIFVKSPKSESAKLDTYPFQEDCIRDFQQNRFNVMLKARQIGVSTILVAYCVWLTLFHRDQNILIVSPNRSMAKQLLDKIEFMRTALPKWLLFSNVQMKHDRSIVFDNNSRIQSIAPSPDAGHGEALTLLIVDEAAWVEDDIWLGLFPLISSGGKAILTSTPRIKTGFFYKIWQESDMGSGTNYFKGFKVPWDAVPGRDKIWFKNQCQHLSEEDIARELLALY